MDIEVLGKSGPVMCRDELLDFPWEVVLFGKFQPFGHVTDDDACALQIVQLVMRVYASLVLGEESRVEHLADVVIECAGTHQLALRTDSVGYFRGKVSHRDGVLESSRGDLAEPAQQLVVRIRQLEHRHRRDESEGLLDHQHQRIGEEEEEAVDGKVIVHGLVELRKVVGLDELEREIDGC